MSSRVETQNRRTTARRARTGRCIRKKLTWDGLAEGTKVLAGEGWSKREKKNNWEGQDTEDHAAGPKLNLQCLLCSLWKRGSLVQHSVETP